MFYGDAQTSVLTSLTPEQFVTEIKKETINKILAYAMSVRGIKMKSNDKILISLN